jgi:hypothetical protein
MLLNLISLDIDRCNRSFLFALESIRLKSKIEIFDESKMFKALLKENSHLRNIIYFKIETFVLSIVRKE